MGRIQPLLLVLAPSCAAEERTSEPWLEDVTGALGLPGPDPDWPDGTYFLPEIMQGGVALLDCDGDGALDLLHVRIPPPGAAEIENRLYRAEGAPAVRRLRAATGTGLERPGFGQGVGVGDADNDGDLDVYVANYGVDAFFLGTGDGRFVEVTEQAGLVEDAWSTAAAFCDHDGDGDQDLYVVRYQRFDPGKPCMDASARREYCGPVLGAQDRLYRNRGDGTFEDVTEASGMLLPQRAVRATGLGIAFLDLTLDGRPDVFVANDAQANQLWVNQGDGAFVDEAVQRGLAYSSDGKTEANMGIAVGDVNGDLAVDLFVTHLWHENNRLYLGTERPLFRDGTLASGLWRHDLERTGFGCAFVDLDHDGDRDLVVANGAVHRRPPLRGAPHGFWADYAEPNQLFENDGSGAFVDAGAKAGSFADEVEVSRGLAIGDLDEDGDLDVVISNVDDSLRAYRNDGPPAGTHWLMVRALTLGRDALGARVVVRACGRDHLGHALAGSSYGSSNDPRAHFGLGPCAFVDGITVTWPDGSEERFGGTNADRVVTVRQGEGRRTP